MMKKLLTTGTLLISMLVLTSTATHGSIITGALTPDSFDPSVGETIYDLDNNGQFDFTVEVMYLGTSGYSLKFRGLNGTKFETDGSYDLVGYNPGTTLGSNSYQDSGSVTSLYFPEGPTIKFVGLTFEMNSISRCAYIGVSAGSYPQGLFYLTNFGYETNPTLCILANASGVGIDDLTFNGQCFASPNPTNGDFSIDLGDNYKSIKVTMTDLGGKTIRSDIYKNSQLLNLYMEVAPGVYLLTIEADDQKKVIRIVKE
jgi:hypothetical protein